MRQVRWIILYAFIFSILDVNLSLVRLNSNTSCLLFNYSILETSRVTRFLQLTQKPSFTIFNNGSSISIILYRLFLVIVKMSYRIVPSILKLFIFSFSIFQNLLFYMQSLYLSEKVSLCSIFKIVQIGLFCARDQLQQIFIYPFCTVLNSCLTSFKLSKCKLILNVRNYISNISWIVAVVDD